MKNWWCAIILFSHTSGECQLPENREADAAAFLKQNRFAEAIDVYNRCIAAEPNKGRLYFQRGQANFASGKDSAAYRDYNLALKMGYRTYDVYYRVGLLHFYRKEYSAAITNFDSSLSLRKYHPDAYLYRGASYFYLRKDKQCIIDQSWCQSMRETPLSFYYSGMARYQIRDYHRSIKDLTKAISLDNSYEYFYYRALAKYQIRNYPGSIRDLDSCLSRKKDHLPALVERGLCYLLEGEDEKAIADFSNALTLQPSLPKANYFRGIAKMYKLDTLAACKDFYTAQKAGYKESKTMLEKLNCGRR